jgi:DNA-binding transcriptional MerR regulator
MDFQLEVRNERESEFDMSKLVSKSSAVDVNARYRSGAAARLSGVPVETLRVWERRYGVTDPSRSERGQRQYSFEDVRRLGLIKQLVDAGNSISALARLDLAQLLSMLGAVTNLSSSQAHSQKSQNVLTIALIGVMLRQSFIATASAINKINLLQTATNLKQAEHQLDGVVVDVMVLEQGELTASEEQIPSIKIAQEACQAKAVLILYRFASNEAVRQLRLAGFYVARIPVDMLEIDTLCRLAYARASALRDPNSVKERDVNKNRLNKQNLKLTESLRTNRVTTIPERILEDQDLIHIANSATSIHCECPRHLVDLLQMLTSFERYSAQCENRNRDDAKLHKDLHYTAAHARSALEQALVRVAQAEGIHY